MQDLLLSTLEFQVRGQKVNKGKRRLFGIKDREEIGN